MPAIFELAADTPLAKNRPEGPNIPLDGAVVIIGRNADGSTGKLPVDWVQVSGKHCKVVLASQVRALMRYNRSNVCS